MSGHYYDMERQKQILGHPSLGQREGGNRCLVIFLQNSGGKKQGSGHFFRTDGGQKQMSSLPSLGQGEGGNRCLVTLYYDREGQKQVSGSPSLRQGEGGNMFLVILIYDRGMKAIDVCLSLSRAGWRVKTSPLSP